jgi:hypothetical protein
MNLSDQDCSREMCFQITQGIAQIEHEICAFYGSEYEDRELTVLSRSALSPDSLVFINCTARINNTFNSLYQRTIFIHSQLFSYKNTHYFPIQYSPTVLSYGIPVLSERYELIFTKKLINFSLQTLTMFDYRML